MSSDSIMLKLSSHPNSVAMLEGFVQRVVSRYQIDAGLHGNILISLTEAVTNAIIHGNNKDASKSVEIQMDKVGNKIAITVSDEGPGFNYNELPDPTTPENICKIGGRGVFLMRQLCDSIAFRNNGSTVEMQFYLK